MARAAKVCSQDGCPEITFTGTRCEQHALPKWEGSTWNKTKPLGWDKTRTFVLRRDNYTCAYCGAEATQVDHVTPVYLGGTHKTSNLVASCKPCNLAKNNREKGQNRGNA